MTHELSRKIIAEAFWTAEVEAELRETNRIGHLFHSSSSREELMLKFDKERSSSCYNHLECSEACKSRGILVHYTSVYYLIDVHVVLLMCVPHSLA